MKRILHYMSRISPAAMSLMAIAVLLPCSAAARTFHKANANELKDGDEVVIATAEGKVSEGIIAIANFNGNGFNPLNITSMIDGNVLTTDGAAGPAVFKIKEGEPVDERRTFAFHYPGNAAGDNNSAKGWLMRDQSGTSSAIKLLDSEVPELYNYATVYYNSNQNANFIRFENNTSYYLQYITTSQIFQTGSLISWFDFYVADAGSEEPEPGPDVPGPDVPDPDCMLTFAIDDVEIDAATESVSDVALGSKLSVSCSDPEALLYYENSALPEHGKMRYDSPIDVKITGRVTYTFIAEVNDVEIARRSITVRTAAVDPTSTVVLFAENPFGMKTDLANYIFEWRDITYDVDDIRITIDKKQNVRMQEERGHGLIFMMASQRPQFGISTKDTSVRLTSISVETVGEAKLGIYLANPTTARPNEKEPANSPRRAEANEVKLGELSGSGILEWDYDGVADLHDILVRNDLDIEGISQPTKIKRIEVRTAEYTATAVDQILSEDSEPEYYDLNGRKLREPAGKGIYIVRDRRTGHSTKMIIR